MSNKDKLLQTVLDPARVRNIRFADLVKLVRLLGFQEHVKGSHHVFYHDSIVEIINLQPLPDGKAKPYQVKQVRDIITRHGLRLGE